tara:strand:- start:354 stop:1136 length:783 start_codon:yes stop_codon:yes gene_type:complete
MKPNAMKVIVFDLDETLGNFGELGAFCDTIEKYNKKPLTNKEFNKIMDLFPIFLRPDIIKILFFLKNKKETGFLKKVYIYTNNNGPKEWAEKIKRYLEHKINYKLFDKIIAAYKVNGKQVELGRTTYNKTIDDFLSITKLPKNTEICFLDDVYHEEMHDDNVFYLKVKPYFASISFYDMAKKYFNINKDNILDENNFIDYVINNMSHYNIDFYNKTTTQENYDKKMSVEILNELKKFLKIHKKYETRKIKKKSKRTSEKY